MSLGNPGTERCGRLSQKGSSQPRPTLATCFHHSVAIHVVAGATGEAGTVLHFFEYAPMLTMEQEAEVERFFAAIQDQPYGYRTLFGFMARPASDPEPDKVICSEAVLGASIACKRPLLLRLSPWQCSPADIFHSPLLKWVGTEIL